MDCKKTGSLILKIRREKGMTQKEIADKMNISPKTVSKWECGLGCPDVSLLGELSAILGVNIKQLLSGDLESNDTDGGNMKKVKFFMCPDCGNIMTCTGQAEISCCGRKLEPLKVHDEDSEHAITVETLSDEYYVKIDHEMSKEHFISFIAYLAYDKLLLVRLYPEQNAELHLPLVRGGKFYYCCTKHGLFRKK